MEIWKAIKDYEGLYEVSNLGNIKSLSKKVLMKGKYPYLSKEKYLIPSKQTNGYLAIGFTLKSKTKTFYTHRLVCEAFLENKEKKRTVNHINGIKTDNRVENLEWATHKENVNHAIKTGLTSFKKNGVTNRNNRV